MYCAVWLSHTLPSGMVVDDTTVLGITLMAMDLRTSFMVMGCSLSFTTAT